ncbi:hypothetical protein DERF_000437 [Dermatophagoides farinae]|uniref:Uncharacterized protein n=1 Tax=Dermatophagoides farinae TaxID=6954 RepID=A0A922I7C2_DERFA|nr:hypothetical protein DERF_000437 [Dermatophagoides farinae]
MTMIITHIIIYVHYNHYGHYIAYDSMLLIHVNDNSKPIHNSVMKTFPASSIPSSQPLMPFLANRGSSIQYLSGRPNCKLSVRILYGRPKSFTLPSDLPIPRCPACGNSHEIIGTGVHTILITMGTTI